MWADLTPMPPLAQVWQSLLSVRSLVLGMHDDQDTWLRFASLCRKSGRTRQSHRTLLQLLGYDPLSIPQPGIPGFGAGSGNPDVMFAYLKHLWATGKRQEAHRRMEVRQQLARGGEGWGLRSACLHLMQDLVMEIGGHATQGLAARAKPGGTHQPQQEQQPDDANSQAAQPKAQHHMPMPGSGALVQGQAAPPGTAVEGRNVAVPADGRGNSLLKAEPVKPPLAARSHLRLGLWKWSLSEDLNDATITQTLYHLQKSTEQARTWSKAWHNWALFNVASMEHYVRVDQQRAQLHVAPAVTGFFRSVALGQAVGGLRTNSGTLQVTGSPLELPWVCILCAN